MGLFDKIKNVMPDGLSEVADTVGNLMAKDSEKNSKQAPSAPKQSAAPSGWSDELEHMVSMAIEDGELTDREIKLLASRAQREGIDPDEFEFTLSLRLRRHAKEVEQRKNQNPVEALSEAFRMLDQYAKGGKKVVTGSALSGVLTLIPGVGQAAAVGGLLAEFIETPSNLNSLKAETIRCFILPDNPEYLLQFINYAASQMREAELEKSSNQFSIKGLVSTWTVGSALDIVPIWEHKLDEACDMADLRFPADEALRIACKKHRPSLANKLRAGRIGSEELKSIPAPKDDEELLEVVGLLYNKKSDDMEWEDVKPVHARLYKEAERRFASNPALLDKLSRYKVKKFGLF